MACISKLKHSGHCLGRACLASQWWQCKWAGFWCNVIFASQLLHSAIQPQSGQYNVGAKPRRLTNTKTWLPAVRVWFICGNNSSAKPCWMGCLFTFKILSSGALASPARCSNRRCWYLPANALCRLSKLGVALPKIIGTFSCLARYTATSRPW